MNLRLSSVRVGSHQFVALTLASLALCVGCGGSSFEVGAGTAGSSSGGGSSAGTAGSEANAGTSAGGLGDGGAADTGGATGMGGSDSGGTSSGGTSSGGTSSGGTSSGGTSSGGTSSGGASAGSGGTVDCATLKVDYAAAVGKARSCDIGATGQCSPQSTVPPVGGCGCATLVNAESEYTTLARQKYQALVAGKCLTGPVCNLACLAYTAATCSVPTTTVGTSGAQCTGSMGGIL